MPNILLRLLVALSDQPFSIQSNDRGVEQLLHLSTELQKEVPGALPSEYSEMGSLVAIDGSVIDSVLSMHWVKYRTKSRRTKLHLDVNIIHGAPHKLFLTKENGAERPFSVRVSIPVR